MPSGSLKLQMFVRTEPAHMLENELGINRTSARIQYKENAGQNNHFLITVLVGLDYVAEGKADLNKEFSTSWSPRDSKQSARRSREYALVTSLAWVTDLVDVYRRNIQGMRSIFDESFSRESNKIDGRALRLSFVTEALDIPKNTPALLMTLFAIKWRNTIVHSEATTRLSKDLRAALMRETEQISKIHRGLDVSRSIRSFEEGRPPSFKEVASFISAAQTLVESMDRGAIAKMNVDQHAECLLRRHFSGIFAENSQIFSQFWASNASKSRRRLENLLTQLGFTRGIAIASLSSNYLDSISSLSAKEARARFLPL